MKKTLIALALSATAMTAFAAPETYTIDPTHTAPRFEYSHLGYSTQVHRFDNTSGKLVIDRAAKTGSVDVSIDTKSVNTGFAVFNGHLQGEDFFDAAQFPAITFKSTQVKFEGDTPKTVDGVLTIKGISKPVTLTLTSFHAAPNGILKKDEIGANAVAHIKRSEFNMGKFVPYISDEVTLSISVEAIKD